MKTKQTVFTASFRGIWGRKRKESFTCTQPQDCPHKALKEIRALGLKFTARVNQEGTLHVWVGQPQDRALIIEAALTETGDVGEFVKVDPGWMYGDTLSAAALALVCEIKRAILRANA